MLSVVFIKKSEISLFYDIHSENSNPFIPFPDFMDTTDDCKQASKRRLEVRSLRKGGTPAKDFFRFECSGALSYHF